MVPNPSSWDFGAQGFHALGKIGRDLDEGLAAHGDGSFY
jgi:hypothetical protein